LSAHCALRFRNRGVAALELPSMSEPRPRRGCLGCLGKTVLVLALLLVAAAVLDAVLAPYNHYLGGHFHWMPGWQGLARIHTASSGGDYVMEISFQPTIPGYRKSPLQGTVYLCTPRNERFSLKMAGSMPRHHGTDLTGVPLHLYMDNYYKISARLGHDWRPELDLYGSFGNHTLAVDDHASIAHAFNPDGTLGSGKWQAARTEALHFVFHEGVPWILRPSCAQMFRAAPKE
jgi:hypothetical protein